MTDTEAKWLTNATDFGGSFVATFASACLNADADNYRILKQALGILMEKYPKYLVDRVSTQG